MDNKISVRARDVIQKHVSGLFQDSALDFYGIKSARIKELINVELPVVEVTDSSTDYIFLLEDNSYLHLEFQTGYDEKDIVRFMAYDVRLYERDKREITTVIIYSSDVKKADTYLKVGSAIYDPQKVMMSDYDGNDIYVKLETKIKNNDNLSDKDIINLIFLPLMKHNISKAELATKSIELAQSIEDKAKRDICIASVVAFGSKYLNENEKKKLVEVLRMADLITMLVEEGKQEYRIEIAKNMILDGLDVNFIQKYTGLSLGQIEKLEVEQ